MTDKIDTSAAVYLIVKRGLFYGPNGNGYTGIKDHAGRYSFDDLAEHCPNTDSVNQDGVSFVLEADAPDYSPACCHDLKERHMAEKAREQTATLTAERNALRAEVERMRNALSLAIREGSTHEWNVNGTIFAPKPIDRQPLWVKLATKALKGGDA